jgi:hypothetical protein
MRVFVLLREGGRALANGPSRLRPCVLPIMFLRAHTPDPCCMAVGYQAPPGPFVYFTFVQLSDLAASCWCLVLCVWGGCR